MIYVARILVTKRVPALGLDLCTYNADGASRVSSDNPPVVPGLSFASSLALERNLASVRGVVMRFLSAQTKTKDEELLKAAVTGFTLASSKLTGFDASVSTGDNALAFGVRRVARLREPLILDIIDQLAASQGRVALDVETL